MKSNLRPALVFVALFTLVCGLAYPLAVTGLARLLFADQAGGSLARDPQGQAVGSDLIGQNFTSPRYFWGRPSAANYDGAASTGSNLGPTNPTLVGPLGTISLSVRKLRAATGPSDERLRCGRCSNSPFGLRQLRSVLAQPSRRSALDRAIPVDLITSSASGLDPDLTPAAAYYQVERVAAARGLSPSAVRDLVAAHVVGPQWGFLGVARVHVLALNRALDRSPEEAVP